MIRKVLLTLGLVSVLSAVACTGQVLDTPPGPTEELGEVEQGLKTTPAPKVPNGTLGAADGDRDVGSTGPFIRPTTIVSNVEPGKPDPWPWDAPRKPETTGDIPSTNDPK